MIGQKIAPGRQPGARTDTTPQRGDDLVIPHDTTSLDDLSILLGQSLTLAERHEAEAWEHWRLAAKHRAIKRTLEELAEVTQT